jgi:hypothetical protein
MCFVVMVSHIVYILTLKIELCSEKRKCIKNVIAQSNSYVREVTRKAGWII